MIFVLFGMPFHMFLQMITPHEPSITKIAFIILIAGMRSPMPRKFITPTKPFRTSHPVARVRSFTSVGSDMRFQMGTFVITFRTSQISARVVSLPLNRLTVRLKPVLQVLFDTL